MIRLSPNPRVRANLLPWWIGGTLVVILLLALLVVRPLRSATRILKEQRMTIMTEAAAAAHPPNSDPLEQQLQRERRINQRLTAEWERQRAGIRTIRDSSTLDDILSPSIEGRIDFKVALFEARQRLGQMALAHAVKLPPDLGVPDTIGADEDTEIRLGQMAATVLLLKRCIEHGIPRIDAVDPDPPTLIQLEEEMDRNITFYPVRIRMTAHYDELMQLLDALRHDDILFALRRLHIMNAGPGLLDPLTIDAEWSIVALASTPALQEPWLDEDHELDDEEWMFY